MDILWPALGISVVVGFVFYVLASHWGRTIRQQAWTIQRLSERIQMLEEVDNPIFRDRISKSSPVPLEQVFTFTFRLNDRFWRQTLGLSPNEARAAQSFGTLVGSIKLERWRSHTIATITEVLPESKTAKWQTRSLDYYPAPSGRSDALTLWELPVRLPSNGSRPPSLELLLRRNTVELLGRGVSAGDGASASDASEDAIFFCAPLDPVLLAEFRSHDPTEKWNGNGAATGMVSWRTFYAWNDEKTGIEWQLRMLDLNVKSEWERWKVLESAAPQMTRGD